MKILQTSIHAAQGATRPLDYAMVQAAVELGQSEDQQLEWKGALTDDAAEVAKDVAALANARGGLLVYGVHEDRATSAATAVADLDITDGARRAFRSKLFARLNPVIPGLAVEGLPAPSSSDGTFGLLAVQVPDSPDAPHVVGTGRHLGVPYRVGTQTQWMTEWEIERAYQDRFARRLTDSVRLDQLISETEDRLDLTPGCWMVTAARPTVPLARTVAPPDRDAVRQTLSEAVRLSMRLFEHTQDPYRPLVIDLVDGNPRVGLRRWVVRDRNVAPEVGSQYSHLELHHDGSLVLAGRLGGRYTGTPYDIDGKHVVPLHMVPGYVTDLIALAGLLARRRLSGQVLLRTRLVRADDRPLAILASERVGPWQLSPDQPSWSNDVRQFQPVDDVLTLNEGAEPGSEEWHTHLRVDAQRHAADLVSQFGIGGDRLEWPPVPPR